MDEQQKHPVQKIVDAMGAAARQTRTQYHLTLGKMISQLKEVDPQTHIYLTKPHSYRGYYSDLAFENTGEPNTVGKFLKDLEENILDKELIGYKGGEFLMGKDTPLWISEYSDASNLAIMGLRVDDGDIILNTKQIED